MKQVNVAAGIIISEGQVLATMRDTGDFSGLWEFPGGKIEYGETPEETLHREIYEELAIDVEIVELFHILDYDYPEFHLHMHCYICRPVSKEMILSVHREYRWLDRDSLKSVQWLPADIEILEPLKDYLSCQNEML